MIDNFSSVLLRTTMCTVIASLVANFLLKKQNASSPFLHRLAATLILLQGWALIPFVLEIPTIENQGNAFANNVVYSFSAIEKPMPTTVAVMDVAAPNHSSSVPIWLAFFWLIGLLVVIGRFVQQYWSLACKLPLGTAPTDESWLAEWNSLRMRKRMLECDTKNTNRQSSLLP